MQPETGSQKENRRIPGIPFQVRCFLLRRDSTNDLQSLVRREQCIIHPLLGFVGDGNRFREIETKGIRPFLNDSVWETELVLESLRCGKPLSSRNSGPRALPCRRVPRVPNTLPGHETREMPRTRRGTREVFQMHRTLRQKAARIDQKLQTECVKTA